uniref:Uncharacterized protein n=1 Tax=Candidatus Desulfatibia profunda TaxID=2841695 RepID=A0A8J6NRH4_9BACT|nr:hypothetical protein [Candidatus Desulfatibia profunda]
MSDKFPDMIYLRTKITGFKGIDCYWYDDSGEAKYLYADTVKQMEKHTIESIRENSIVAERRRIMELFESILPGTLIQKNVTGWTMRMRSNKSQRYKDYLTIKTQSFEEVLTEIADQLEGK